MHTATQYFLWKDESQLGPLTMEDLRGMLDRHEIAPQILCVPAGSDDWKPLGQMPGLYSTGKPQSIKCPPVAPIYGKICPQCGSTGREKTQTQGSIIIEIALWLMLLVPGMIYSVWRLSSRTKVCPACRVAGMIPMKTPRGQQLWSQYNSGQPAP